MARGDFKQRVVFEVEDQASGNVDKVQGRFSQLGTFLSSRFTITLGDVADLFRSVAGAAGAVIEAAQTQEDAVASLDQALAGLGPRANDVSEALQAQAAALESTTKFGDEAIIQNQALALNLGVSSDQMVALTNAAVELSAATGGSLESSFVNLARTLNGARGELGELVPELADMSEEALRSGAALEVINNRLGGSAAAQVKTFSGVIAQLGNAWGSVQEKVGAAITENEAITIALEKLRNVLTSRAFLDSIEFLATGFSYITVAIVETTSRIGPAIQALRNLSTRIDELRKRILKTLGPFGTLLAFIGNGLVSQATSGARALGLIGDAMGFVAEATGLAADFNAIYEESTKSSTAASTTYADVSRTTAGAIVERAEAEEIAAVATNNVGTETEFATDALVTYEEANRRVRGEADELTRSLERTARAAAQVQSATGGSLTARDRRSQADVDAALAAGRTATLGGTRIRTADGSGSRLLR